MTEDRIYQIIIGVLGVLAGVILRDIKRAIDRHDEDLIEQREKVLKLEIHVAEKYLQKDEFLRVWDSAIQRIENTQKDQSAKLDYIMEKLGQKVDKDDCDTYAGNRRSGHDRRA